jgi:hypothetical protein
MVVQRASEAKVVRTFAVYGGHDLLELFILYRALDSVLAVGCGAPPQVLFIVDIGPREQFLIPDFVSAFTMNCGEYNLPVA